MAHPPLLIQLGQQQGYGANKRPLLCLLTSCSQFKTTSLHPTSGPWMLRACSKAAASSIPAGLAAAHNHKRVLAVSGRGEVLEKPSQQAIESLDGGGGVQRGHETFMLLIYSDIAWGHVGKQGEARIQPRSPRRQSSGRLAPNPEPGQL